MMFTPTSVMGFNQTNTSTHLCHSGVFTPLRDQEEASPLATLLLLQDTRLQRSKLGQEEHGKMRISWLTSEKS